ncbi:MAG TPA: FAD-binding oxidoreductase [Gaiellaceae bacterium]|nr:FAD-binding oxidoreductase [Gaiellaceae bacterium]
MTATQAPQTPPLESTDFERLAESFRGELLLSTSPGYDAARRIWNGAIDRHPAYIARCTGVADVVAAVRFARERDLLVAVRSGGHGVGGHAVCDGGLVIDLSAMKGIRVDPSSRTATAQAGVLWGELDRETQLHGLATVGGIVTHTGIAGLTLGGGIGWLMRKYGATVDNLLSVDLVTADGDLVTANADESPELFWGVRGGGGNLGIVTSFEYRLHPVGPIVLAGPVFHPLDDARELLRFYREFAAAAPDELTTIFELSLAQPLPFLPVEAHGKPIVMVGACYAGPPEEGVEVVRALKEFGNPIADLLEPKPYVALQSSFDPFVPHGWHRYWKSVELPVLTEDAIETLVEHASAQTSPRSYCIVFQLGGALSRVGRDETAFTQRDAAYNVNINAVWTPEDADGERHVRWARDYFAALQPHARDRVYSNFLGDEGPDRVRQAYGAATYDRLAELKATYDPDNFFRLNQNIRPA